jgi:hypothetical protein
VVEDHDNEAEVVHRGHLVPSYQGLPLHNVVGVGNLVEAVCEAYHNMDLHESLVAAVEVDSTIQVLLGVEGDTMESMAKDRPLPSTTHHFHCHILAEAHHRKKMPWKEESLAGMEGHGRMRHLHDYRNYHVRPRLENRWEGGGHHRKEDVHHEILQVCKDLVGEEGTHVVGTRPRC